MRPFCSAAQWQAELLDVEAYLDRLGITGPLEPDAETLRRLHRAHALTIPFENLDILLGRGIDLDVDVMQSKLLRSRRGGYCYEHNMLFAVLLERLGYEVTRLYARPLLDAPKPLPRTHLMLSVAVGGETYLADVGFGDEGPLEPILVADGTVSDQGGWVYRLAREEGTDKEWVLLLKRDDGWFPLYWYATEAHHHIDCVVANYFISTHGSSPFTGRVFLERIAEDWRLNLNHRKLTLTRADGTVEVRHVADGEVRELLAKQFGIELTEEETAVVVAALPAPEPS
ncbi:MULTISPECIES: arylamine N-acetyltransferase family protein [unclassified Streptomyces]|uniref:arylamine N-acetyltransferase family protein n=1 Tax=unclassified Streptomyces TaxID=2593676 RepID=UPI002E0F33A8|nr:arylamine N-acetyltransferase [Streptomyces sp. NBC_01296]WSW60788.1 arylamine N-acetyltransferase [Streptomyces sp. NBC_00998]